MRSSNRDTRHTEYNQEDADTEARYRRRVSALGKVRSKGKSDYCDKNITIQALVRQAIDSFCRIADAALHAMDVLDGTVREHGSPLCLGADDTDPHETMGSEADVGGFLTKTIDKLGFASGSDSMTAYGTPRSTLLEAVELAVAAGVHHNLGVALYSIGKTEEAIGAYENAILNRPFFPEAYYNLGIALQSQGKLNKAALSFMQAIALKPDFPDACINLGNTLRTTGDTDKAIAAYGKAIEIDENCAEAYFNLGNVFRMRGETSRAIDAYYRAIGIRPNYAQAYQNLGTTFYETDHIGLAVDAYREAVKIDPGNLSAQYLCDVLKGKTMEKPPEEYVRRLFDQYSSTYEHHMLWDLCYKVPKHLKRLIQSIRNGDQRFEKAIDLGCGTGLAGKQVREACDRLIGVDISPKMVQIAAEKMIYDDLIIGEITECLCRTGDKFNLVIAADVFVYVGNLRPVFKAVRKRSAEGAYFVFTTETAEKNTYVNRINGRFAHGESYVRSMAREQGFDIEYCRSIGIRKEDEEWVEGGLYALKYANR